MNITQLNADVIKEAPLSVQWEVPEWLIPHIDKADRELPALLSIPNIVLRANGNRVDIQKKLLDEGIETIGTEGKAIYYNPRWLGGLFREDRVLVNRVYLHMVMHGIFRHMVRRKGRDKRYYNLKSP
mgnify:CR=1 FL=1